MRLRVHISVNRANVSRFVNNEGRPIRSLELLHDAAVGFTNRELRVGKQRKPKLLLLLKFFVGGFIIDANPQNNCICPLNLAQLIPERAEFCRSAAGEVFGIKCQGDILFPQIIA